MMSWREMERRAEERELARSLHSLSGVVEASVQGHHQERADQRFVSDSETSLLLQSPNEDEQNLLQREREIMNNS